MLTTLIFIPTIDTIYGELSPIKALHQLILDIQETKEAIAAHTIPGDLICMEKVSMRLGLVALVLLGIMLAASQQAVAIQPYIGNKL